jgi:hypothetical protein
MKLLPGSLAGDVAAWMMRPATWYQKTTLEMIEACRKVSGARRSVHLQSTVWYSMLKADLSASGMWSRLRSGRVIESGSSKACVAHP